MDEDLGFKIQMTDVPVEPVKQQIQQPQSQPKGEAIPLTSSNYDLNKASHPKACIFTFLFKLIALITYMFLGDLGKVFVFIIVVVFSAFDFWTVKNITGRLLVGLKWENTFTEDGTQSWEFYSTENKEINIVDSAFFWSAQISSTFIWGLFAFLNILNPFWICLDLIAFTLSGTNLYGFYKCRGKHQNKINQMKNDLASKGFGMEFYDEIKLMNNIKTIGHYNYDESNCLGQGAYGKVYEGINTLNNETVAIKKLDLALFEKDKYLRKQIVQEVEIISKLNHLNIVKFVELVATKKFLFIITEMCRNGDLKQLIAAKTINEAQAFDIIRQIIEGFKELVKNGVIHRDMKPANVLNDQGIVKIADFGFAKYVENYSSQLLKSCVGSPLYMAPQVLEKQHYSTKCDIWSLGVIYYEMLFFDVPWKGRDEENLLFNIKSKPLKFNEDISEVSKQLLKMCLSVEEDKRATWKDLFQLFDSTQALPQSLELFEEESIQKVPSWVVKPMQPKTHQIPNEEIENKMTQFIKMRETLAHKHFAIVEMYNSHTDSPKIQQLLVIMAIEIVQDSKFLMNQINEFLQKIPQNLQKGTLWKIQEQLESENCYYEMMETDIQLMCKIDQIDSTQFNSLSKEIQQEYMGQNQVCQTLIKGRTPVQSCYSMFFKNIIDLYINKIMEQFKDNENEQDNDEYNPLLAKQRSRRLCCFIIESNWSIMNQIMLSLIILTSITLLFVSSQVILGLYLTKSYFLKYSKQSVTLAVESQYTTEAQLFSENVTITNDYNQNQINIYQIIKEGETEIIQQYLSNLNQNLNTAQFSTYIDQDDQQIQYYLSSYLTNSVQNQDQFPYTITMIVVPAEGSQKYSQLIFNSILAHFDQKTQISMLAIGSSYILLLLIGWLFAQYIIRPLKLLTEYALQINQNITSLSYGKGNTKKNKLDLKSIKADDKIGELVDEFKNLIQGLAGLKKKTNMRTEQKKKQIIVGYQNIHQEQFSQLQAVIDQIQQNQIN